MSSNPGSEGRAPHAVGRVVAAAIAAGTIVVGIAVNRGIVPLDGTARDVTGDALWAFMMTWWIAALWPRMAIRHRGLVALAISVAVELSQLVHTPWLDALRRTTPGRLVLGSGFDARDLVAYALGVAAAMLAGHLMQAPLRGRSRVGGE